MSTFSVPPKTKTPAFSSHSKYFDQTIQRKCNNCKDEEETIQRKPLSSSGRIPAQSPAHIKNAISSGGHLLDQGTRSFFESRFNRDLGSVRIHTDSLAEKSAKAMWRGSK